MEQKFCRACGIELEKIVEFLNERQLATQQDENSLRQRIWLESFGTVAFGGLLTIIIIAVGAIIYAIVTKLVLTGSSVLFGILLTAFIVFALLSLIYVFFNETLKETQNKRKQSINELNEPKITANLIGEKHFEPATSVTENSTELLYSKNKTQKLQ
jgi:predicted membrane protein